MDFELSPGTACRARAGGAAPRRGRRAFVRRAGARRIPFAALGLAPGDKVALAVHVLRGEVEVERLPRYGYVTLVVPDADFERIHWRV